MYQSNNIFPKEDISNILIVGNHIKIKNLKIRNIGRIKELDLTFNDNINVICGANGVVETTILNIIADHFGVEDSLLTRKFNSDSGEYTLTSSCNDEDMTPDIPMHLSDFDGCVLIDEIEEHLHPSCQDKLVQVLKKNFPKVQFIVTTHSPIILQSLDKNEIIPLYIDKSNKIAIKELNLSEYGLQGWTLEEILKDVMGVPNTTSQLYQDILKKFDKAMNEENGEEVLKQYKILDKMLNPSNILRKLLKIQIADWEE